MGEKKRKHSGEDGKEKKRRKKSSSSKSSVSSSSTGHKVKAEVIPFVSTDVKPMVIDFPNNAPPPSLLEDPSEIQWNLYQDSKLTRKKYLKPFLLKGESETMEWEGRCFQTKDKELSWGVDKKLKRELALSEEERELEREKEREKKDKTMAYEPLEGYFKTMVGVYSKKEGKVKIYEVAPCVHLYQHVKGFDTSARQTDDDLTYKQKQEQLVNLFGSKKRKSEQKKAAATDISQLKSKDVKSAAQMDSILSDLNKKEEYQKASKSSTEGTLTLLPPYDSKAVLAADIFPVKDLLPDEIADTIDPKILLKMSKSKTTLKRVKEETPDTLHDVSGLAKYFPPFALVCAEFGLKIGAGKEERNRLAKLILYGVYLVRVFGFCFNRRKERGRYVHLLCPTDALDIFSKNLDIPLPFLEKVLHLFSIKRRSFAPGQGQKNCYMVEDVHYHKLTNYILIIALTLNDFEFGFEEAVQTLSLPRETMKKHFSSIGCVPKKSKRALKGGMAEESETSQVRYCLKAPLMVRTGERRKGPRK